MPGDEWVEKSHAEENEATIIIAPGRNVALVLDNMLARWRDSGSPFSLHIGHDAEWHALATLGAMLEGELIHLYSQEDYAGQVALARQQLIAYWGDVERNRVDVRSTPGTP
jgi:hypothetical protein